MAKKKNPNTDTTPSTPAPARRRVTKPAADGAAAPTKRKSSAARQVAAARPDPGVAEPGATPAAGPRATTSQASAATNGGPSHDDISREAYLRYLERGGSHGQDFDDWVEAERRLRQPK